MGAVLSYSGLSTKIRAMTAKLVNEAQFREIAQLSSVSEVVSYLKKTKEYEGRWDSFDEERLHRGEVEKLLKKSVFQDYTKLYHFCNPKQRGFMALYFKRYEIFFIKECIRYIFDHRRLEGGTSMYTDLSVYAEFFHRHSKLDIERMVACGTIDELIQVMEPSEYFAPISRVAGREKALAFDYGMVLDLYYFGQIWKVKDHLFKGVDLENITKAYGRKFDVINLQWIQRAKQYYNMDSTRIFSLLIPVAYKLKQEDFRALANAANMDEFYSILDKTYYGRKFPQISTSTLDEFYNYVLRTTLEKEARKTPYSVISIYSFMYHKEHEVDRLTTAIECIRYGVDPEETMRYIQNN